MTREFKVRLARVSLALLLLGAVGVPNALAESVTVRLDKTIDTKGTPAIARQNPDYQLLLSVPSTSAYQVDCWCYGGDHSNNCGKYMTDFKEASGYSRVKTVSSTGYPYARATIYGNKKEDRKTGCWATLRLSNDK